MKKLTLILAILGACTSHDGQTVGDAIVADCGPAPLAPGYSVAYETVNGYARALLTPQDFKSLATWRNDVERWQTCVVEHP